MSSNFESCVYEDVMYVNGHYVCSKVIHLTNIDEGRWCSLYVISLIENSVYVLVSVWGIVTIIKSNNFLWITE